MTRRTCKTCFKKFNSRSLMAKHLYKAHPELYAKAHEKRLATRKANRLALLKIPTAKMLNGELGSGTTNGAAPKEMTAKELFSKLKEQQTFLNNIVSLVEQMIHQHEKTK